MGQKRQRALPAPMVPMLATAGPVPTGDGWSFEFKKPTGLRMGLLGCLGVSDHFGRLAPTPALAEFGHVGQSAVVLNGMTIFGATKIRGSCIYVALSRQAAKDCAEWLWAASRVRMDGCSRRGARGRFG
jgi:hypothetical protein